MSSQIAKAAQRVTHELHGVVVSAGLMQRTVKVRVGGQKWNKVVKKVCERLLVTCTWSRATSLLLSVVLTISIVVFWTQAPLSSRSKLFITNWRCGFYSSRLANVTTEASCRKTYNCTVRQFYRRKTFDTDFRRTHSRKRGEEGC